MVTNEIMLVMGSQSDWATMSHAAAILEQFALQFDTKIISAHRTPLRMVEFATTAQQAGVKVIIAGAGGAAHLPGMLASLTTLPVLGVPVESKHLAGMDSLLSIVQMPSGVPVATFAIGRAGAENAALFAVSILAASNPELAKQLAAHRAKQTATVAERPTK